MNRLFRPFLALTAVLGAAAAGIHFLRADPPAPGTTPEVAPPPRVAKPLIPVRVTDARVETVFAVKPKELSPAVKKGLEYLVKAQREDGGWNQGGGWRSAKSGRVEGADVKDPSDVGNTALALLALVRAGNTLTEGAYKTAVQKGLAFIIAEVEKADTDSLSITSVKDTQLQSKIGRYVDTFLVNLLLSELHGRANDQEKKLAAALEKTMTKIVKHQTPGGTFPGNEGWAPVLSVALANKSIVRAKQNGVVVDDRVLDRMFAQSQASASGDTVAMGGPASGVGGFSYGGSGFGGRGGAGIAGGGFGFGGAYSGTGDAGVRLYRVGQGLGNLGDVTGAMRIDGERAKQVLKDAKASTEERQKAEKKLDELKKAEEVNAKARAEVVKNVKDETFVAGFGSNGGEEFLSFLNISEALLVKGGKEWEEWDAKMVKGLEKAQDKDGSWQGQHCITGRTFCTAGALLVLMADRTPFPREVLAKPETKPAPDGK
jgi:hypothetical protein